MSFENIIKLLGDYAQEIPYCEKIIISSTDGLIIKSYPNLHIDVNETLAASSTSMLGVANATSISASKGTPEYALVRSQKGFMLILGQERFSVFIVAGHKTNLGLLLLKGQKLSEKLVQLITPTLDTKKLDHPIIFARELETTEQLNDNLNYSTNESSQFNKYQQVGETQSNTTEKVLTFQNSQDSNSSIEIDKIDSTSKSEEIPFVDELNSKSTIKSQQSLIDFKEDEFCQKNISSPLGESIGICEENYFKPTDEPVSIPQIPYENEINNCKKVISELNPSFDEDESKNEEPKEDDFIETRKITPVINEVKIEEHNEQEHVLFEDDSNELKETIVSIQGEIKEAINNYNDGQISIEELELTIDKLEKHIIELTKREDIETDENKKNINDNISDNVVERKANNSADIAPKEIFEVHSETSVSAKTYSLPSKELFVNKPLLAKEITIQVESIKKEQKNNPLNESSNIEKVIPENNFEDTEPNPQSNNGLFKKY